MASSVLRIAMNGITGRMGYRQHLLRSILPIRDAGGVELPDGSRVQVEPILVGRNEAKIRQIAEQHGVEHWTTDADAVIADPSVGEPQSKLSAAKPILGHSKGTE
jgi:predicted dehydrogenase